MTDDRLSRLAGAVLGSRKYAAMAPELVSHVGALQVAAHPDLSVAIKETKRQLHRVAAAFVTRPPDYGPWQRALARAHAEGQGELRRCCRDIMQWHASTRERLAHIDRLFVEVFEGLSPVDSVLDVACGLNPLAIPWMPLAPHAHYVAYDAYTDLAAFLQNTLPMLGVHGFAIATDVLTTDFPDTEFDVALLLKALPCLEQISRLQSARLLERLHARSLVVSFPTATLGGRRKGMATHYDALFGDLVRAHGWEAKRFDFSTEIVYRVRR